MIIRPPRGLRSRLVFALLAVTGVAVLLVSALLYWDATGPEETVDTTSLVHQAAILERALTFDPVGRFTQLRLARVWVDAYRTPSLAYYTLYDAAGQEVARSPNLARPLPWIAPASDRSRAQLRVQYPGEDLVLAVAAPHGHVLVTGRELPDYDVVSRPGADDLLEQLGGLLALAFAAMVIVYWVVAWSLRPLRQAARDAAGIGPANPDNRLSQDGVPAEVAPLVTAINASLDRLAEAYAAERTLTAAAAHALRTPLAVLHLRLQRAEAGSDRDLPAMRRDIDHLNRLVGQLLSLARKEQGSASQPNPEDLDLARLARTCIVSVLPIADAAGRRIELEASPGPVRVTARPGDLHEAVVNLLENALTHGAGTVTVTVGRSPPTSAWIEVADEGPGVPRDRREALFGRFRKGDASSVGAGLGLAIVRHVARSLGGEAAFVGAANLRISLPAH